jgi:hypothetical protein
MTVTTGTDLRATGVDGTGIAGGGATTIAVGTTVAVGTIADTATAVGGGDRMTA